MNALENNIFDQGSNKLRRIGNAWRIAFWSVMLLGLGLRLWVVSAHQPRPQSDAWAYTVSATNLMQKPAEGYAGTDFFWPMAYPSLLAAFSLAAGAKTVPFVAIAFLNIIFGLCEILLMYRLICYLTLSRGLALAGALITAVNPAFLAYTPYSYSDLVCSGISTLLILLLLVSPRKRRYSVLYAILAVIGFHANARMISFFLIAPLFLWAVSGWKTALFTVALLLISFFTLGYPRAHAIRRHESVWQFGSIVGGVNLWLGNNTKATGNYVLDVNDPAWTIYLKERLLHPVYASSALSQRAIELIRQNPQRTIDLIPARLHLLLDHEPLLFIRQPFEAKEKLDKLLLPPSALTMKPRQQAYLQHQPDFVKKATRFKTALLRISLFFGGAIILSLACRLVPLIRKRKSIPLRNFAAILIPFIVVAINLAVLSLTVGLERYFYILYSPLTLICLCSVSMLHGLWSPHRMRRLPLRPGISPAGWALALVLIAGWSLVMFRFIS